MSTIFPDNTIVKLSRNYEYQPLQVTSINLSKYPSQSPPEIES